MSHCRTLLSVSLVAATTLGAPDLARAQAVVKPDGQWRAALGLGASLSSGNSDASNLSVTGDAVRATDSDKTSLYGNLQYARSQGVTTAEQVRLGGRQDHDLSPRVFAFGGLDFERNKFANLKLRSQLTGGLGLHVLKSPTTTFDIFGGAGYTSDKYIEAALIDDETRTSYGYASLLLGEESTHQLTETTSFKQRLTVVPNLRHRGEFRANWDAGLAVAMTQTLNLTVGAKVAHNSEPGPGRKKTDTLLTTGITVNFN
jgi:putative salt-induced outer membrane protein YdiY